ncbi:MAG: DUF4203 domain-containing protein [Desulfobulbaceae bacterium]|nr:DUF4203 domain-containing protein [Desulfobulbaceae bacterium]
MEVFNILLGIILLLFGRKLFWVFVAVAGFIVGIEFAAMFLADKPQWVLLLVGFATGSLGAIVAIFAQRFAFALAGFYAGTFLTLLLVQPFISSEVILIFLLAGGLIGAGLSFWILDPALIILSCLIGAGAIVKALGTGQMPSAVIFVLLVAVGIFTQTKLFTRLDTKTID